MSCVAAIRLLRGEMNKLLVALGILLAASSSLVFLNGRSIRRRQQRISAAKAAALLAEAWADHHTRA